MRCLICAELATNHGGDLSLAKDMIQAASEAGADLVKVQVFDPTRLRASDPQAAWFKQSALTAWSLTVLHQFAASCGVGFLATGYTAQDLRRIADVCGTQHVKIGSGEGRSDLAKLATTLFDHVYLTLPWGCGDLPEANTLTTLATVPLYPAPPECYARIQRRDGYSDHHIGLDVAKIAILQGATILEKHFHIDACPEHRRQAWNMTPEDVTELRRWAEVCAQATEGTKFQGRWIA